MFTRSLSSVPSLSSRASSSAAAVAAVLSLSFAIAGCAAEPAPPPPAEIDRQHQADVGGGGGLAAPVTINADSNGKSVGVVAGQAVVVFLPSNGTTGYEWGVSSSTAAPLGEPAVTCLPGGDAPGGGGSTEILWANTANVAPGQYTIALAYKRSWEPAAIDTFSVVLDVVR